MVTEIFASREPVNEEFSSLKVVQSMSHPDVHFLATNDQVSTYLISNLQEGDSEYEHIGNVAYSFVELAALKEQLKPV